MGKNYWVLIIHFVNYSLIKYCTVNGLITCWRFSIFYYLLRKCDELCIECIENRTNCWKRWSLQNNHPTAEKMSESSRPEVFLRKGVLKICGKFTGDYPYRSAISIKLLWNFIEIAIRPGDSPVNLLHIFIIPFYESTSGWLLLKWILAIRISENVLS